MIIWFLLLSEVKLLDIALCTKVLDLTLNIYYIKS